MASGSVILNAGQVSCIVALMESAANHLPQVDKAWLVGALNCVSRDLRQTVAQGNTKVEGVNYFPSQVR